VARVRSSVNTSRLAFALGALALAACGDRAADRPPPTDRFYYPIALAVRHLDAAGLDCPGGAAGCTTQLLVVSSNFDLAYDVDRGGTILSVAVPPDPPPPADPREVPEITALDVRGALAIGSLAGELAVVEPSACAGWGARPPLALVTSRASNALFASELGPGLGLAEGSVIPLDPELGDPYGVGLACRGTGSVYQALAYVGYLTARSGIGYLGRVDLLADKARQDLPVLERLAPLAVDTAPAQSFAYQADVDRLFFTGRFAAVNFMPFRYLELGNPTLAPRVIDVAALVQGSETGGFALSSDRRRAYVALRLFDAFTSQRLGVRPPDTGGALGIIDLSPGADGSPRGALIAAVPIGRSPGEVRIAPRAGKRDLVVVSCPGDDSVWLYDDDTESVAKVFGTDALGRPQVGRQPFALALEARLGGALRVYAAAFDSSVITVLDIPDPGTPRSARVVMRLGRRRP